MHAVTGVCMLLLVLLVYAHCYIRVCMLLLVCAVSSVCMLYLAMFKSTFVKSVKGCIVHCILHVKRVRWYIGFELI